MKNKDTKRRNHPSLKNKETNKLSVVKQAAKMLSAAGVPFFLVPILQNGDTDCAATVMGLAPVVDNKGEVKSHYDPIKLVGATEGCLNHMISEFWGDDFKELGCDMDKNDEINEFVFDFKQDALLEFWGDLEDENE